MVVEEMEQTRTRGRRQRGTVRNARSLANTAFIVEALVLLAFLICAFALFTQLFAQASEMSAEGTRTTGATYVAQTVAEEFSADPVSVPARQVQDGFTVTCSVQPETTGAGTLYHAHIVVSDEAGVAFEVTTARYVSGVSQ